MKILILLLASCATSQATVLRWLGWGPSSSETTAEEHSTPSQQSVSLPVTFQMPEFAKRFLDVYYLSSPEYNIAKQPINFLTITPTKRPIPPLPLLRPQVDPIYVGSLFPQDAFNTAQGQVAPATQFSAGHIVHVSGGIRPEYIHFVPSQARPVVGNFVVPTTENHSGQIIGTSSLNDFNSLPLGWHDQSTEAPTPTFEFPDVQQLPLENHIDFNDDIHYQVQKGLEELVGRQVNRISEHSYALDDGSHVSEQTSLVVSGDGSEEELVKSGEYQLHNGDGKLVNVRWVADNNGFRVIP